MTVLYVPIYLLCVCVCVCMQCHALSLFIIHKKCYEIKYKIGNAENLNTEVIYIILLVRKLWKQAHLYEPRSYSYKKSANDS